MRINLFAGPGAGKSALAGLLFGHLKIMGYNVEQAPEYVKEWAYLRRAPQGHDFLYIFAKQLRAEELKLRNGVDHIVSDSPLMMQFVYAVRDSVPSWRHLLEVAKDFENQYPSLNIFLDRGDIPYKRLGRYEDETQAKAVDALMLQFLADNNVPYFRFKTEDKDAIINHVVNNLPKL